MNPRNPARSAPKPTELHIPTPGRRSANGYSLLELLFALGLTVTIGATALPQLLLTADDARASGAARFLAARLQEVRMEAIARSTDVGFQFVPTANSFSYAAYVDGNSNGIRSTDIQRGADRTLFAAERLTDRFPGVDFGVLPGLPSVDPDGTPPGTDPIKLGASSILTFTPLGTSTSGSLYVRGRRDSQFVIRIFGETAKTRVLRFDPGDRVWKAL
jgi:type II secretory pathway pseudopilin PulG